MAAGAGIRDFYNGERVLPLGEQNFLVLQHLWQLRPQRLSYIYVHADALDAIDVDAAYILITILRLQHDREVLFEHCLDPLWC